jgi:hypothetical protein
MDNNQVKDINKQHRNDMASAAMALREYNGQDSEDIETWLQEVNMVSQASGLNHLFTRNLILLKLRKSAQTWGADVLKKHPNISLAELTSQITKRFENKKYTFKLIENFLGRGTVKNKEDFIQMIQEADQICSKGLIECQSLMKLLISRAPPELRTIMF